ncbi:MAG: hypothetical protein N2234_02315 [Planctomycetota bacterium]|nr:hypothetical protein [Planctomycetota bacterium]
MGASFLLVFKAHVKRSGFYILISIFITLCFLGALYDLFSLGGVSTLASEVYAGLAILLSVCVPLFSLADFLEQEEEEECFDLTFLRPVSGVRVLAGRFLGAWTATSIALVSLSLSYYIATLVCETYLSPASNFVLPLALTTGAVSCAITLLLSPIGGFVAVAVALLSALTASHIIAFYAQSAPLLKPLSLLLPPFHLANLQSECAADSIPSLSRIFLGVFANLSYTAVLLVIGEMFLSLRHKPAE